MVNQSQSAAAGVSTAKSSKPIRGILFDKDGTLIDFNRTWLPIYTRAAEFLANRAGKPGEGENLMTGGGYLPAEGGWVPDSLLASGSNEQIYQHWLSELGVPELGNDTGLRAEYDNLFRLKHGSYAPVLDDLDRFLGGLQSQGIMLGVATMDDEASARHTLDQMGCRERFEFVCGADSGFGVKPEPGMVEAFCTACDLSPESVVMVGDSPRDLQMGRNAAVGKTVGVLTGTTTREHLLPFADWVFDDISGISRLIE